MNKIVLLLILLTVSCDKNIGILFDVSGSMENSFNSLEYFCPLIDRQKYFIYALTLVNN